jgi:acyl-CoA reductase-like NAD-dependent aldehyde dehydrogenase
MAVRGRAAQPDWAAIGFDGRGRVLRRMQQWMLEHAEDVIGVICSETGKAYEDAQIAEFSYGVSACGFWANAAPRYLADERLHSSAVLVRGKRLLSRYRPFGLIGVIGPWNYPLSNSFGDCLPALAAGNSVILKPSEITPLTGLALAEGLRESGLPDDVFQVATGRGETGAAVVDVVDMVMFTGSTDTGRKVGVRAMERLIPASLELGGKDPMIVLADADIERAANHASYYSMLNCGQSCVSIERVYVEAPVYDEFVNRVVDKVRALRQGPPAGAGSVDVGSLAFPPQVGVVEQHVRDAVVKGAEVLVGGSRGSHNGGYWFEPTVLTDVTHDMECMREETFGPTLPIMRVRDVEDAIRLANDSPYGLSAAVFSRDIHRAEAVARRLEAGTVTINDALVNYTALELPMGGGKPSSGIGRRHGAEGIRKYCAQQSLLISRFHLRHDIHTHPYSARKTRMLGWLLRLVYGRARRR